MALTTEQKAAVGAALMRQWSRTNTECGCVKADLAAAITDLDAWIEANGTAINQAIPEPARSALSAQQKLDLFYVIAVKRSGRAVEAEQD